MEPTTLDIVLSALPEISCLTHINYILLTCSIYSSRNAEKFKKKKNLTRLVWLGLELIWVTPNLSS